MNAPQAGAKRVNGANGYERMAAESGVSGANPHQLISMLYEGALTAIHQARSHMQARRIADKGAAIGKAIRIIDEGLKISLDPAGGELTGRLLELYDYLVMRLLQANLRNEESALIEVAKHLTDLQGAWNRIAPTAGAAAPAPSSVAAAPAPPATPGARAAANPFAAASVAAAGSVPGTPRVVVSA